MSAPGWMPLHVSEYLADTGHLSASEHGAYLLLIMHYWQHRSLPDDDRKLARICRMASDDFASARDTLAEFFGEGWTHKRIDAELAKADEKYEKRASAGRKGGIAKASASIATAMPEQCSTNNTDIYKTEEDTKANALVVEPSPASTTTCPVAEMVEAYHEAMAPSGCPRVAKITPSRKARALQRLKDCKGIDGWKAAMAKARASPFLTGANATGWKADFDFFLQATSFTKLLEGSYDARQPVQRPGGDRPATGHAALLAAARKRLAPQSDGGSWAADVSGAVDAERNGSGRYFLADSSH
ncbi:YdaU family protein [Ancylobacter oerskovii]|uniref:YdaU family protein n=1 Tax=Ancylobacter oerskovii TaxID=459519 RepID=A0ABW4Z272_9HYPH|nr:DUF1376 domain-containing protein [Ancylobacter oerskovii]MBS7545100.1 YdaU family protein [Ancylobacter oerskovii]